MRQKFQLTKFTNWWIHESHLRNIIEKDESRALKFFPTCTRIMQQLCVLSKCSITNPTPRTNHLLWEHTSLASAIFCFWDRKVRVLRTLPSVSLLLSEINHKNKYAELTAVHISANFCGFFVLGTLLWGACKRGWMCLRVSKLRTIIFTYHILFVCKDQYNSIKHGWVSDYGLTKRIKQVLSMES